MAKIKTVVLLCLKNTLAYTHTHAETLFASSQKQRVDGDREAESFDLVFGSADAANNIFLLFGFFFV